MRVDLNGGRRPLRTFSFSWRGFAVLAGVAIIFLFAAPRSPAALPKRPSNPIPIRLSYENCTLCHKPEAGFSHPTGMVPTMPLPEYFPLVNGRMGCSTCHDGGNTPNASRTGIGHNATLRGTGMHAHLCMECHQNTVGKMAHRTSGRAHLQWAAGTRPRNASSAGEIDSESRTCLTCHDGSVASAVGDGASSLRDTHDKGHPVGVVYNDRPLPNQSGAMLAPRQTLDSRIRLFDAKVGCGTCHSPYSHESSMLIMSNDRSRLCYGCHRI